MERVDYTNVQNMASLLQRKTAYTPGYVHFVSVLYHCLLLPGTTLHHSCNICQSRSSISSTIHLFAQSFIQFVSLVGDSNYDKYWRLIDRIVQQTVIQQDHGVDPDVTPISINVQKLVLK